jgi:hypothetical protein
MGRQRGLCTEIVALAGLSRIGGGSGSITVQDEGVVVDSSVTILNFIGADVQALSGGAGLVSIYIPPPAFASHWNSTDGNTTGTVQESISRTTSRISEPTSEGNPFKVGSWGNSNQAASTGASVNFGPPSGQAITGLGGDANFVITVFDANGSSTLATYTTPALTGNGTSTSGSGFISLTVSNYAADTTRFKGEVSVTVQIGNIQNAASLQGGKYNVRIVQNTNSSGDGTGPYTYNQVAVFYDTNPNTPGITGAVTMGETGGSVLTKHLSGIEYYISNSAFTASVQDINNLNRNTARATSNLVVSATGYGISTVNHSPFGTGSGNFSNWTIAYDNTGADYANAAFNISSSNYRYRGTGASISAYPRDPWGNGSTITSSTASILVDTYGTTSTDLAEYFDDENRRQTSTYNTGSTSGNWTSANSLGAGEALIMGGQMLVPNQSTLTSGGSNSNWSTYTPTAGGANPNYTGLGAPASYFRTIVDTSGLNRSSFTIVFSGTFVSNATTDLTNSHLEIYIRRRASANGGNAGYNISEPLRVHGLNYNFATFDDGDTVAGSYIRESSSSGNTVNCTFGGFSCETGFFIEVKITNTAIKIGSFVVTFF